MVAYRFCRPDDIPLLVEAVNDCFVPYAAGAEPMTLESIRAEMQALDLWPSNSMVAIGPGDRPVGVSIGTKREHEVLVLRLGVRPEARRQGVASHLVTSLSQKLAVLGPPRLVMEVPTDLSGLEAMLEGLGWSPEGDATTDWARPPAGRAGPPSELLSSIDLSAAVESGLIRPEDDAPWRRCRSSLRNLGDRLEGLALASAERIEGVMLYEVGAGRVDVLASGVAGGADPRPRLGAVSDALETRLARPIRLVQLDESSVWPVELGFQPIRRYRRWGTIATPL